MRGRSPVLTLTLTLALTLALALTLSLSLTLARYERQRLYSNVYTGFLANVAKVRINSPSP